MHIGFQENMVDIDTKVTLRALKLQIEADNRYANMIPLKLENLVNYGNQTTRILETKPITLFKLLEYIYFKKCQIVACR